MEDTIKALLEYLVFPLLPVRESEDEIPSEIQHQRMAKQMNAVVLLYNYYYVKHFQKLEVIGFELFCKICCLANPGLIIYMRHVHKCEEYSEDLYSKLSITEKMIMDACKICIGLDSSKDMPNMERWPISKVAVFLVDPLREKCLLQFSSTIEGVWSLVEKVIEPRHETGVKLEQHAFSIVEQETGIIRSDLSILDRHLTYSLSDEKTRTQLYIMSYGREKCTKLAEVPIADVIRSLEGPIVKRSPTLEVELTPVVEYYNLLPYADIISSWLSRGKTNHDSFNMGITMEDHVASEQDVSNVPKVDMNKIKLSKSGSGTKETYRNELSLMSGSSRAAGRSENKTSTLLEPDGLTTSAYSSRKVPDEKTVNNKKNNFKNATKDNKKSGRPLGTTNSPKVVESKCHMVQDRVPTVRDNGNKNLPGLNDQKIKSNKITKAGIETIKKGVNDISSNNGSASGVEGLKIVEDISEVKPGSIITVKDNVKGEMIQIGQSKETVIRNDVSGNIAGGRKVISDTYTDKMKISFDSGLTVYANGSNDEAGADNSIERACIRTCTDRKRSNPSDSNQDGLSSGSRSDDNSTFCRMIASKKNYLIQTCLGILQKKRDEQHQQQRLLDDEIACTEMSIQTILSEEDNSPSKAELIIEILTSSFPSQAQMGVNLSSEESSSQPIKRRKLSEAILTSRYSCQELDDICHRNSWMLPRYRVSPSFTDHQVTGSFKATVTVEGVDFEYSSEGDMQSSPSEARNSAAAHMMTKLRRMANHER